MNNMKEELNELMQRFIETDEPSVDLLTKIESKINSYILEKDETFSSELDRMFGSPVETLDSTLTIKENNE